MTAATRIEVADGVTLHVRDEGEGNPTMFIHGWAVSGRIWDPIRVAWTKGRTITPDLRGTGWSTKPRDGYTFDNYVADVVKLIDTLELTNLALVGHSMGGAIVQKVALERPDALRSLVLLSPVPAGGVPLEQGQIDYFRSLAGSEDGGRQILSMVMKIQPAADMFDRMVQDVSATAVEAVLGGFDAWRTASFNDARESPATSVASALSGAGRAIA